MRVPACAVWFLWSAVMVAAADRATDPFPGEQDNWVHLKSPHFELYTNGAERGARESLHRLEIMRAVFFDFFKLRARIPLEVTVFRFKSEKTFDAYRPSNMSKSREIGGLYVNGADRATVLIGPSGDAKESRHVVNHEFIHHLFHVTEESPPTWYNEGMADLLATLDIERDKIVIGRPREGHVLYLREERLMPLERLFAVNHSSAVYTSGTHTGLFYAQSWGVLHYLYFGETKLPADRLDLFLRLARQPGVYESPETMPTLLKELLGLNYDELLRRIQRYFVTGTYRGRTIPIPVVADPQSYARRPVSQDEIHTRLAELSVRVNGSPLGKLALLWAVEREPNHARLHEVLGAAALLEQDASSCRAAWERAIAAGSTNPAIYHYLAQLEGDRWFGRFDYSFRMRPEQAEALRSLLLRSIAAAPDQSAAYELLAWVEGTALEPNLKNANLVQSKLKSLKDQPRALLGLALLRVHVKDQATALRMLDQLDKMNPSEWVAYGAEQVRARLESRAPRELPRRTDASAGPRFHIPSIELPD